VFGFPATIKNVIDRFFIILEPDQVRSPRGGTEHPKRFNCHPKSVLISSCGFPEIENFDILRQHFRKICDEMSLIWSGEIFILAAGIANAPKLFDRKYELIRKAGTDLIDGQISKETMDGISAPVMPVEDYIKMATASFAGGVMGKMKTVWIAMKAILKANKKD